MRICVWLQAEHGINKVANFLACQKQRNVYGHNVQQHSAHAYASIKKRFLRLTPAANASLVKASGSSLAPPFPARREGSVRILINLRTQPALKAQTCAPGASGRCMQIRSAPIQTGELALFARQK